MNEEKIYYHFDWLNGWFAFNTALTIVFGFFLIKCPCLICWPQMIVLIGVTLFSWAVWAYKYIKKHIMAVVTDETIKIDHNNPLKWKDVKSAEEKMVRCCFKWRKVLVLRPKPDIDYKYSFLQKHNSGFEAFSIPLYGLLTPEDEQRITEIVAKRVKIKKLK